MQIAAQLRRTLRDRLGITLSCGVASTKLLARLASPLHKPNGLTALHPGHAGHLPELPGHQADPIPQVRHNLITETTQRVHDTG